MKRHLSLLLSCLALAPRAGAGVPTPIQDEDNLRSQPFALPLARDARTLAERARDHLDAARWSEAIADLQRLLEEHGADVLPDAWRPSADRFSVYASFPGAASWARARLEGLPDSVRRLYRERYEPVAQPALARAREEGTRRALADVARRYPVTLAAASAWWTLGDLELERGHVEDARLAYTRARDVFGRETGAVPPELDARLERTGRLEAGVPPSTAGTAVLRTNDTGAVPRGDADRWPLAFELAANPLTSDSVIDTFHQFPVLSEDRVLVNTAYRMYAVDAYTGSLLWQTGPPAGWSSLSNRQRKDLAEAIALEDLVLAPAVSGNIVVGAMQIPFSINPADKWQGIEIMEAIPERRLFAFDAMTGRELWNHEPPLRWDLSQNRFVWDENQGSYAQRMLVAAPPVVSGARLYVPCYRMSGRIEYHVACYEIETGERLWSTALVSGQRETNMFGRAGKEFVASPVTVTDGRVIAQTELGTVAALDVLTGEILWEALYEQIPLPKTLSYNTPERDSTWRISAPTVVGDLVLSTPRDSRHLVAFYLTDGRTPWSMNQRAHLPRLRGSGDLKLNLLLGAEDDVVYMAGDSVVALQKPGGLDTPGSRFELRWSYPLDNERSLATPRPVLGREEVVVPLRDGRIVLDKESGAPLRLKSSTWSYQEYGNVLVGDGTLYTLNRAHLSGFFDWEALLERARLRLNAHPDDPEVVSETAELLLRRGTALKDGGDPGRALSAFAEARRLLEPQRSDAADPELDERLFRVLRQEALVHADLGAAEEALAALDRARPLAPRREDLRDVLLQEERLLRRDAERRLAVLAELERRCAGLALPYESRREGPDWIIGEAILDPEDLEGWQDVELPIGLWVLLGRAESFARLRDGQRALEDLHAALARYGDLLLNDELQVEDVVGMRIERRIELDGTAAYRPFEERALALFESATAAGDARMLEEVVRRFPHSAAAAEAQRTRLAWAYGAGDGQTVVELAYATLSDGPGVSEQDALGLLRVASVLERGGNAELHRMFLERLAGHHGDLPSDLVEHGGKTLDELAAEATVAEESARRPAKVFDTSVHPVELVQGSHEFIGELPLPPEPGTQEAELAHVYLRRSSVRAFSSASPSKLLFPAYDLPFAKPTASIALSRTRIVAGGRHTVLAIDTEGATAWRHDLEERITDVSVHDGIVLILAGPRTSPDRVYALDAHDGLFLWELVLPEPSAGTWRPPVFGDGIATLFLQRTSQPASVLVLDLPRGKITRYFDIETMVGTNIDEHAWISEDVLFVPSFRRRTHDASTLHAYGTTSGAPLWSVPLSEGEALSATIRCQGRDYLVTVGLSLESGSAGGGVYLLEDPLIGVVRPVVRFRAGEEPMGLGPRKRRLELEEPLLFLESLVPGANTTPVRAVNLPYGNGWTHSLPVSQEDLYANGMPMPAVSRDCVVMAYVERDRNRGLSRGVRLIFLDKETGVPLDRRDLNLGNATEVELFGLGRAVFVVARGSRANASKIQILETER